MRAHQHHRQDAGGRGALLLALLITLVTMCVELTAGYLSGSIALLADAGHMLTDASALGVALFAAWIATKPATPEKTYGYYRTEILAALLNGAALWLLVAWIVAQALRRLQAPPAIQTDAMLVAAALGLVANLLCSRILWRSSTANLNVRGARLHVLADALGSCGVLVAGIVIRWKGWTVADPLASLFIGLLIAISSVGLIRQAVNVLLEATPAHLNVGQIVEDMRGVQGVRAVHDVHLWTITTGMEAMSGHIVVDRLADGPCILDAVSRMVGERFGISHTTFQLEPRDQTCEPAT